MGFNSNSPVSDTAPGLQAKQHSFLHQSFSEFIKLIISKWILFFVIGLVAGIAGFIKASLDKVKYQSYLSFVVDEGGSNSGLSGAMGLAAQFGLNLDGADDLFSGDNIVEIMKSRRLVENVLLSVDTFSNKPATLIEYYLQNSGMLSKPAVVHFPVGQQRQAFTYAQDSVLFKIYSAFVNDLIEAERIDKRLSIFSLKVKTFNERFSKIFTNNLIRQADSFYIEIRSKKARQTLEVLEQRVALMKNNFNNSISSKASTEDANINSAFSEAQVPVQKQQANIQVYGTAYAEMFKNLELARFQYLKRIPLIQIIDEADYPLTKIKDSKIKTALFFAIGVTFVVLFILWLVRIYRISK